MTKMLMACNLFQFQQILTNVYSDVTEKVRPTDGGILMSFGIRARARTYTHSLTTKLLNYKKF